MWKLADMPAIFQIETTSFCNLRCVMCTHPIMVKEGIRKQEHIDLDLFKTIIDRDTVATKKLGLHILGEPLMNPGIVEMVKYVFAAGIMPELATNGTIMSYEWARQLIQGGLQTIWFSFDGGRAESYEAIRVNAKFEKVVSNIRMFLNAKKILGYGPKVIIQMVGQPGLENEEAPFRSLWENEAGVDRLTVKFLDSWAGTLMTDIVQVPDFPRHPCAEPFVRVSVLVNGDVVPCCRDWAGQYIYGNLAERSLEEIWRGIQAESLRAEHVTGQYITEPCRSCREWHIPMDREIAVRDDVYEFGGG